MISKWEDLILEYFQIAILAELLEKRDALALKRCMGIAMRACEEIAWFDSAQQKVENGEVDVRPRVVGDKELPKHTQEK